MKGVEKKHPKTQVYNRVTNLAFAASFFDRVQKKRDPSASFVASKSRSET